MTALRNKWDDAEKASSTMSRTWINIRVILAPFSISMFTMYSVNLIGSTKSVFILGKRETVTLHQNLVDLYLQIVFRFRLLAPAKIEYSHTFLILPLN